MRPWAFLLDKLKQLFLSKKHWNWWDCNDECPKAFLSKGAMSYHARGSHTFPLEIYRSCKLNAANYSIYHVAAAVRYFESLSDYRETLCRRFTGTKVRELLTLLAVFSKRIKRMKRRQDAGNEYWNLKISSAICRMRPIAPDSGILVITKGNDHHHQ